jgi:hypothetical protein
MKKLFKTLRSDKILFRFFLTSIALISISFFWILLRYRDLPPIVPVFNQLPWGESRLAPTPSIFLPNLTMLLVLIVNTFVSTRVYENTPLISRMLSVTNFLVSLLGLLFIFRTIQLIT